MRERPALRCPTLQHVLDALLRQYVEREIDGTLAGEARCAIHGYCNAVGKQPSKCKADIVDLLARMDGKASLQAGYDPRAWSNLKSLLRRALNMAGNPTPPARRNRPVSPVWDKALAAAPDRDSQIRLRPFFGYCTDRSIAPKDVTEATFGMYAEHVRDIAKSKNVPDTMKKVRRCWNKLADALPAEQLARVATWKNPKSWGQPVSIMPPSFQEEMALFRKARSPLTYEQVFRCRPLRTEGAVDLQCQVIMRVVTVLIEVGHPASAITSFDYLTQSGRFEEIMRALKKKTGAAELRQLGAYVSMIHWLAETWRPVDAAELQKLKKLMEVVGSRRAEISDSTLNVLEQLEDRVKREKLKWLGDTIFAEFKSKGERATRIDAENFREAIYWELGLTSGWRPATRARINIQDNIRWGGSKRRRVATLKVPKSREKTEIRLTVELPESTSEMLQYFIEHALPLLRAAADPDNPYLFPGYKLGRPMVSYHLSHQSEKLIALRTHVVGVTGHKSRHVAVKLHLIENPGDWVTVQEHVGHRNVETTKTFYANVTQVESSKRVQKSLGKRK
jgi:integrase